MSCTKDLRPLLIITTTCGFTAWDLTPLPLIIICICCIIFNLTIKNTQRYTTRKFIVHATWFILFWCTIKFIPDYFSKGSSQELLVETSIFALRLTTILLLGITLISISTPRRIALSATWYLLPLLKQYTSDLCLALSLMISTIPQLFRITQQIIAISNNRFSHLSKLQRIHIITRTVLRFLLVSVKQQPTALLAKHATSVETWTLQNPPVLLHMIYAIAIAYTLIHISYISI